MQMEGNSSELAKFGNGSASPSTFNINEYCQRIQQEYTSLDRQFKNTKQELNVVKTRKNELEEHCQKSHMMVTKLTLECNKQAELIAKYTEILSATMSHLPHHVQQTIKEQVERTQHQISLAYEEQMRSHVKPYTEPHPIERADSVSDLIVPHTKALSLGMSSPDPKDDDEDEDDDEEMRNFQKKPRTGRNSVSPTSLDGDTRLRSSSDSYDDERGSPTGKKGKGVFRTNSRGALTSSPIPNTTAGIPKSARLLTTLPHGDVVCTVSFNGNGSRVFTGGKGSMKIWDLKGNTSKPIGELRSFSDCYIRCSKFSDNERTLIVGGETNSVVVWDAEGPTPRIKSRLTSPSATYALAVDPNTNLVYASYADGSVGGWDLTSGKQVQFFSGHTAAVSSVEVSADGTKLITGSLDTTMRIWDINTCKEIGVYGFPSQIFSLAICPGDSWVALGLENSHVEVLNLMNSECKYQLHMHENCVLSLKFANNGKWFVSAGKDKTLNSWRSPFGNSIFQCREPNSILCTDISQDDCLLATGSGERLASIYEVIY